MIVEFDTYLHLNQGAMPDYAERSRKGLPVSRSRAESDLSSVHRRRSSEPQVVTVQLSDGPATHQLHVALDFGSEIFKRPFNTGLTRGSQSSCPRLVHCPGDVRREGGSWLSCVRPVLANL
jgi:hypothetical protein